MEPGDGSSGLRSWLQRVDAHGELLQLHGADWDCEMGAIHKIVKDDLGRDAPAMLFDDVPGYPSGYRVLYDQLSSVTRFALAVGIPEDTDSVLELSERYREKIADVDPLPANVVSSGPVRENVRVDDEVDLTEFPVPVHNEGDGGRYIGTADCVITKDPESDWVNTGTYRAQLRGDDEVFLHMIPGQHGDMHMKKYFERDEPMPTVMTFGQDPLLYLTSGTDSPMGISEIEYAGGIRGEPYDVIEGEVTGLPIPADAEIAIEGHVHPGDGSVEGPFAEGMGFYSDTYPDEPYMTVDRVYFRDDPIITSAIQTKPPRETSFIGMIARSSLLRQEVENAGVPGVDSVCCHEVGGSIMFNVISIEQQYPGHARQAGYIATQAGTAANGGRWTIVVDEDIDPTDLDNVVWAMCTRCDPIQDIETIDRSLSKLSDTMVTADSKESAFNSRAIVHATIPYERMAEFPETIEASDELYEQIMAEWSDELPI